MIVIKLWQWVVAVCVLLVIAVFYLIMRVPLSLFFNDEMQSMGVTDIDGASLSRGELWVSEGSVQAMRNLFYPEESQSDGNGSNNKKLSGGANSRPRLLNLSYRWCPSNGIGTWCVAVENDLVSFDAVVTPRSSQIKVVDANIHRLSTDLFGAAGTLMKGSIRGKIQSATVTSYECPMQNLEGLSGQLEVSNLRVMGSVMGDHQVAARSSGSSIEVVIDGESVEGKFSLANGAYQAQGQLVASGQLETMARSLMRSLGANRYGWEIDGKIPC